jgi:uncharacterized membrane protein
MRNAIRYLFGEVLIILIIAFFLILVTPILVTYGYLKSKFGR